MTTRRNLLILGAASSSVAVMGLPAIAAPAVDPREEAMDWALNYAAFYGYFVGDSKAPYVDLMVERGYAVVELSVPRITQAGFERGNMHRAESASPQYAAILAELYAGYKEHKQIRSLPSGVPRILHNVYVGSDRPGMPLWNTVLWGDQSDNWRMKLLVNGLLCVQPFPHNQYMVALTGTKRGQAYYRSYNTFMIHKASIA